MTNPPRDSSIDSQEPIIGRFKLSLRLKHPSISPEEISAALGMAPWRAWKVGDPRQTPAGLPLKGHYEQTYWCSPSLAVGQIEDLISSIERVLDRLEKSKDFLVSVSEGGGRIEFFIGWFAGPRSGGDTFEWRLLRRLSDLRIDLSFDVYDRDR